MDMHRSEDTRNVIDKYKGMSMEAIITDLDATRVPLEIAVENLDRDFNMGTIIRTANAFNVSKVHIIGRRQWNKRGAMKTDAYLQCNYHATIEDFFAYANAQNKEVIAVDIIDGAVPIHETALSKNTILVFGSEGSGLSKELLSKAAKVVFIEQFGSTRSINVGVAAGIAMFSWVQQHVYPSRRI